MPYINAGTLQKCNTTKLSEETLMFDLQNKMSHRLREAYNTVEGLNMIISLAEMKEQLIFTDHHQQVFEQIKTQRLDERKAKGFALQY